MNTKLTKKQMPRFRLKFSGNGIDRKSLPFPIAFIAAQAVRRLITNQVPEDDDGNEVDPSAETLRIIDVKNGSAELIFELPIPGFEERLDQVGSFVRNPDSIVDEHVEAFFSGVRRLSDVTRRLGCVLQLSDWKKNAIAEFGHDTFDRVTHGKIVTGTTSIVGRVERVGGSSAQHCALRIEGRKRQLIAKVASEDVVRELGHLLYKSVTAEGKATWVGRRMRLTDFEIYSVREYSPIGFLNVLDELRNAGGDAWDRIPDVTEYLSND